MILFSLVVAYLMLKLVLSLSKDQDVKHAAKVEKDRQRAELREALRQNARMH